VYIERSFSRLGTYLDKILDRIITNSMRFNFNLCEEEEKKQGNLGQEVKQEEEEQEDFDITD